jgi:WD40 repeat protein
VPIWQEESHIWQIYDHKLREIVQTNSGGADLIPSLQTVIRGHSNQVSSVMFSPDWRHVVSGSDDTMVQAWDADTGSAITGPLKGHTHSVISVGFSPDEKLVVSRSWDYMVLIWNVEAESVVAGPFKEHAGPITSIAFSSNG